MCRYSASSSLAPLVRRREVGLARRLLERLQLGSAHQRPLGRRRRHLLRRDEVSGEYEQERPPLDHGAVVDDLREERRVDGEAGGEASKEEGVGPCELDRGEEPDRAARARKPRRDWREASRAAPRRVLRNLRQQRARVERGGRGLAQRDGLGRRSAKRPGSGGEVAEGEACKGRVESPLEVGDEQQHAARLDGDDERLDVGGEWVTVPKAVRVGTRVRQQPGAKGHSAASPNSANQRVRSLPLVQ
mmetsp:Transcript_51909/g.173255  ORF Transcript_51909/g.173255 Transcript_51909/m.173255 type:complete len:246 (-) Transcript_51909:371-1108(-)